MLQSQQLAIPDGLTIDQLRTIRDNLVQLRRLGAINWYHKLYPWQREFVAASAWYIESCLMAANQIGKSLTGSLIDAMHLLGDYPPDWVGHQFKQAPLCWGLGYSMEKTRDILQTLLFGQFVNGSFQGGLVPADRIVGHESAGGVPNAMRTVYVQHATGANSAIQFWSYSQGQHAIMGDVVDWVHVDEEPRDQTIRPQLLTRTLNGDNGMGGRVIYTFTPENGRTDLVVKFMDDPAPSQFFMQKGWADAPHISAAKAESMLAAYPAHQREMRTKGVPMLGHGRIYDIAEEFITCTEPVIPPHWFVIDGMDFGDDHPQAHIQLLEDRDNNMFYVTRAFKARRTSANDAWGAVKHWAEGVPTAWPHDGLQGEKARDDSLQLKEHYELAGFTMLANQATWQPGGNSVETGLFEIGDLLRKGQMKFCHGLNDLFAEVSQYHRNENGRIVKTMDDLLDAIRYAYMMRRYAIRVGDVGVGPKAMKFKGWS